MQKRLEASDATSCFNRAKDDEPLFVLLGRDASAPVAIRAWINHRLISGKNKETDPEIVSARRDAEEFERYRAQGLSNRSNEK